MKGISVGISSFFKAIPFIFKNKLGWVFIVPLVLIILLYMSGLMLVGDASDELNTWLMAQLGEGSWVSAIGWIVNILIQIVFFIVFAYINGYIILVLLSPLFAWLSERTEEIITGNTYPFNFSRFMQDIWRGVLIALRNILYETGLTLLILLSLLIPGLNILTGPASAFILFLISSYFYGFSFMDYNNERKRYNVKQSVSLMRKYRGMTIANGAIFSLSLLIPIIGLFLAGFTAIIATVAATIALSNTEEFSGNMISET